MVINMSNDLNHRVELADILEAVASSGLPVESALARMATVDSALIGPDHERAFHLLKHFEADADIRLNDSKYGRSQKDALLQLAERLRRLG